MKEADFSELKGKVLSRIVGLEKRGDVVTFSCKDGSSYLMKHDQD